MVAENANLNPREIATFLKSVKMYTHEIKYVHSFVGVGYGENNRGGGGGVTIMYISACSPGTCLLACPRDWVRNFHNARFLRFLFYV